jgi:hypothetical protein
MADDHSGTDGDIRLMSYVEIATARGITRRSATRLVFKSGWRRIRSNTGQTLSMSLCRRWRRERRAPMPNVGRDMMAVW